MIAVKPRYADLIPEPEGMREALAIVDDLIGSGSAAAVSTLSPKLSRPKHHGLEVMALHMPTGIYLPTLLTA